MQFNVSTLSLITVIAAILFTIVAAEPIMKLGLLIILMPTLIGSIVIAVLDRRSRRSQTKNRPPDDSDGRSV